MSRVRCSAPSRSMSRLVSRATPVLAALVLLPAVAFAQRGMGDRSQRDVNWNKVTASKAPPALTRKDIESMDPVRLLLEKRKELKLTDAQVAAMQAAHEQASAKNAPLLARLDTLSKAMRPSTSVQGAEDEARMVLARDAAGQVLTELRTNHEATLSELFPTLEEPQQATARKLLDKQREETDKVLRQKMGGRGGMPGGRVPGRPPAGN